MNQTGWIAVYLFLGFIVFITVRGELSAYQAAILGTGNSAASAAAANANADVTTGIVDSISGAIKKVTGGMTGGS